MAIDIKVVNGRFCTCYPMVIPKPEDTSLGWRPSFHKPSLRPLAFLERSSSFVDYIQTAEDHQ